MDRREFTKLLLTGAAGVAIAPTLVGPAVSKPAGTMKGRVYFQRGAVPDYEKASEVHFLITSQSGAEYEGRVTMIETDPTWPYMDIEAELTEEQMDEIERFHEQREDWWLYGDEGLDKWKV